MSKKIKRVSEGVFGPPGWGKSHYLLGRCRWLASKHSVTGVFLIDPPRGFSDFDHNLEVFQKFSHLQERIDRTERIPRACILQFDYNLAEYRNALAFAIDVGNMAVLIDECHIFAPARKGIIIPEIRKISTMGRHLQNRYGDTCPIHYIIASQRPLDIHTQIRDNLSTVIVGKLRGQSAQSWLRNEYDTEIYEKMSALQLHEWIVVSPPGGELPPLL